MEDFFKEMRDKKITIWDKIYLWWKFEGKYYHKTLSKGIKNLINWVPIIWKDREWDSSYIFEIMKHKLIFQSDYIGGNNRHTRAKEDARRMKLCVKLIQKIQDGDYQLEYMDYAEDRHWFEPCKDKPGLSTWNSENIWEKYDDYFKKYPLVYKRVMNGEGYTSLEGREDDKHLIAMSIAHLNHDRARKLLFNIMSDNIEKWWD